MKFTQEELEKESLTMEQVTPLLNKLLLYLDAEQRQDYREWLNNERINTDLKIKEFMEEVEKQEE